MFDFMPKGKPEGYTGDLAQSTDTWQNLENTPTLPGPDPYQAYKNQLNIPPLPTGFNSPLLPGENPNTPAWFHNIAVPLSSPIRSFMNLPFNQRASQAGAEVATGQKFDSTPSTGNQVADVGSSLLGELMGFTVNPGGAANIGASTFNLGQKAAQKVLPISLPNVVKAGAGMAAGSVANEGFNALSNNEPLSAKNMATTAGINTALGLLPLGIGKGLELRSNAKIGKQMDSLLPQLENNPVQDIQNAYKAPTLNDVRQQEYQKLFSNMEAPSTPNNALRAENPSQYFGTTQADVAAAFPPRKVGQYAFTTGEQRAMDELTQGMQTAQNFVKHNDILAAYPPGTTVDQAYADIKANTGADIPKLTENLVQAQNAKTPLTPERLQSGRAAGVIPDLKPRDTLTPQSSLSQVEQPNINLPQPELRTWTNKDNIPTAQAPFRRLVNGELANPPKAEPKFGFTSPTDSKLQVAAAKMESPTGPDIFQSKEQTAGPKVDYTKIHDITGFEGSSKDMYRILEQRLGKDAADQMMDPFTQSKGQYADLQSSLANEMKSTVVDGLGIKKGSKESALVQKYGEKAITLDELKAQSPDKWQNIVKADQWFRDKYNSLIDKINATKKEVYPNAEQNAAKIEQRIVETKADTTMTSAEKQDALKNLQTSLDNALRNKFVPKRADYYRHFQEMAQGVSGLKNIFENPTMIDPRLEGKTTWTKPRSKWASIAQQRTGNQTQYDAVGGFLNYLPQASYAIHIDPHISRFRALSDEIANATVDTKNANNLVRTLQNYANDLSGKTNPADRYLMENVPGGRMTVAALGWLQNRIKSNVILGNLGSAVSQVANVPNGIAFAKQYSAEGAVKTLKTIIKPSQEMAQSPFLKERYGGPGSKVYAQFDTSLLSKPKQFATWVLETADKLGSEFIWNSAYAKGTAEGVNNVVKYADDVTRKLVAGRGVGEVPLLYKSKFFGLIAPFQLEVGNLWHIQKDMISSKDFAGLATLYLSMYAFNRLSEQVKGSGVTFDPIQAVIDASQPGLTPLQRGGRLAGEIFSNVPLGQSLAKMAVPEYGGKISVPWSDQAYTLPSRKELFGKNDPTRFGTGNLIADTITSPQKIAQNLVLPFGGSQIFKTVKGVNALRQNGVYDASGTKLSYPVTNTLSNQIKGPIFGPSGLSDTQNYYDLNRRPLTADQTNNINASDDRFKAYEDLMAKRKADALAAKLKELDKAKKGK